VIRVVVADDQSLVRGGFVALLGSADDIEVVGEASDGEEAVAVASRERPDVILMDVRMPQTDGIEATRRIVAMEHLAATKVVILTTFDLDEYVYDGLRAGASGFLLKDTAPSELLAGVRAVAAGQSLLAPTVTRRIIEAFLERPSSTHVQPPGMETLTEREREVLVAVGRGLSNTEIADTLFMSPATAKTHVSRLLAKLHARDRAQLVVIAYESGAIVAGSD
jgi:DNA-binding NarL/FixJ family response regulator